MQRYFSEEPYIKKDKYNINGENYHHIVHVMRMSTGQKIYLVFQDQVVIVAEIVNITESDIVVEEREKEQKDKELPIHVTIASGFPKGDKLEWVVQKGTELGSHGFIGFPAKNSVVKWDQKKLVKKTQRLEKIALEAAEQSHRQWVPTVTLLAEKHELIQQFVQHDRVIIAYEESAKTGERSHFSTVLSELTVGQRLLVVIGPEGGFSSEEINLFLTHGAEICGLGPRILRAETAPLYALSAISYQFELV